MFLVDWVVPVGVEVVVVVVVRPLLFWYAFLRLRGR
jgi:hypothetical protein